MNARIVAITVLLMMLAPAVPVLSEGPWIQVNGIDDGDVLTIRTYELNGTAAPSPDAWIEASVAQFEAGAFDNMTLTKDGALTPDPYLGEFQKDVNNPLIDYGEIGAADEFGARFGAVLKDGDTYKMWAQGLNGSYSYNLLYLESNDGVTWDSENATISLGVVNSFDEIAILPGTVIKDGGTYKMWYTGQDSEGIYAIGYATSTDGIDWTKGNNGKPVLNIGPVNMFDGGGVATPAVIKENGKYKMFYAGMISYSDYLFQIGLATSADGISWTRENHGEPVLSFGKSSSFDKDGLFGATVIKDGPVYRLFYIGIPSMSVGQATSSDGYTWQRSNAGASVLEPTSGTFDENGIQAIGILRIGNTYKLYYGGMDSSGYDRVGLAEAKLEGLTGVFESDIRALEYKVDWTTLNATANLPEGTTLSFLTRSSNDRVDWSTWKAPVNGMNANKFAKFMQYRVILSTPDALAMPSVSRVFVGFEAIERVEVSTDNSTWYLATGTTSWNITLYLKEGPNTIYIRIMDTTQQATYKMVDIVVDTIKPTGIIKINSDEIYTTETEVDLQIMAIDARGVTKMRVGTSEDLQNNTWLNYTNALKYTLPETDGVITMYCQVMDNTGLISNVFSDTIILDTTLPNGTVQINGGAPMTTLTAVQLSLSANDINGITDMRVSNKDDFNSSQWKPYARIMEWALEPVDGEKKVYVEFKDSAGNTKVFEDTILLDSTVPTGAIKINADDPITTDMAVTITINAQDKNGIAYVMLSNDKDFLQGIWVKYNGTVQWTLPEKLGPQTVYAKFKDTAGLVGPIVSDSIILDVHEEAFEGTILLNDGDVYSNSTNLTATLVLLEKDSDTTVMLSDNQDFTGASWVALKESMSFTTTTANGIVTVYAKFKDKYGIISPVATDTIIVDTTPPTVTLTKPKENSKTTKAKITLEGVASDDRELQNVEVLLPNGAWMPVNNPKAFTQELYLPTDGKYSIQVRAIDEAGNVGTTTLNIKYVKGEGTSTKVPGFESSILIVAVLVLALVVSRRKKV